MRPSPWADGNQAEGQRRTLWLLRHAKTVTDPPPGRRPTSTVSWPHVAGATPPRSGGCFAGAGEGLGPALQKVPRPTGRAGLAGRPHGGHGRAGPGRDGRSARAAARRGPLRGRPRRGACLRRGACPTTSTPPWSSATTRPPTPSPRACCPPATRRGTPLAMRNGFPTCALGVYAFNVDHWADVADRTAKLVATAGAALRLKASGPCSGSRPGERRMAASPWPPPPHSATAAVDAPRRRSSSSAVSATRVPDMPTGWPSAMAPPLTLTLLLVDAQVVHRGQADGGEGLVDLEEVDGAEVDPGLAGRLDDRPRRLGQQRVVGPGHHAVADELAERAQRRAPWPWPPTSRRQRPHRRRSATRCRP